MVGYVYSFDFDKGYNNLLIKAYDTEDFIDLNENTPCDLYSVNRMDGSFEYVNPRRLYHKLTIKQIKSIAKLIIASEADDDYPKETAWEIIPGGNVNERGEIDVTNVWYIPTEVLDTNLDYVNISNLCFKDKPSNLEASLYAHIMRLVCYFGKIYGNDTFADCAGEIFIASDMCHYEKALFGTSRLSERFKNILPMPLKHGKISREDILEALGEIIKTPNPSHFGALAHIVHTQREAGTTVCAILKTAIEECGDLDYLFSETGSAAAMAFAKLTEVHTDFERLTGCTKTDMQYLNIRELHEIFVFPEKALKASALIKKKRRRRAYIKTMDIPTAINKGKTIF